MNRSNLWYLAVFVAVLLVLNFFFHLHDDDELAEQVVETLRAIADVDTGQIEVSIEDGVVTLGGPLPDHESRRIVIEEVKEIDGVKRIIDEIIVDVPSDQNVKSTPDAPR